MANAVAKAKDNAVSTDVLDDIMDFAGEGAAFDSSEMQIPFVRLLQPLSPQLNKKSLSTLMVHHQVTHSTT